MMALNRSLTALALSLLAWTASAQNSPRVGYIFPAGAKQGATFEATVGGQFLDGVTNVYFSGSGIRATVLEHKKPLSGKEFQLLRDKLKELQDQKAAAAKRAPLPRDSGNRTNAPATWTSKDEAMLAEVRKKLANPPNPPNPALAETALLEITVSPDAERGERELRMRSTAGLSNPLIFIVDALPEFVENEPKSNPTEPGLTVTIPAVLNGQILPGDVDRFRFNARAGQRLTLTAHARQLIPYLADAVPGWFQATLCLRDSKGKELVYNDDYRLSPDPVLFFEIPKEGEYTVEIKDAIFRGREDFVYRIRIGEFPFITSHFPLGSQTGGQPVIELKGWNLPETQWIPKSSPKDPEVQTIFLQKENEPSNPIPFSWDSIPDKPEIEANNYPVSAQPVSLPIMINGRIDKPGDVDLFRFNGEAGAQIVAEVAARKFQSPLDSVLKLTDSDGRQIAWNDDFEDKGAGLTTHHADARLSVTLPKTGAYVLHLADAQRAGSAEHTYRLRISPPRPDFELRVVPATINARPGATVPVQIYAFRKDGCTNEISIQLESPKGFALGGATLPPGADQVRLTLSTPAAPLPEPATLTLKGKAVISGRTITRPIIPANDVMQAFAYHHLVPAKELKVALIGRSAGRSSVRIVSELPVKIPMGGEARLQIAAPPRSVAGPVQLELNNPPEGIAIHKVSFNAQGAEVLLHADESKVEPGLKGNLIIEAFAAANNSQGKPTRRNPLGALPAIPFEVLMP